MFTPDLVKGDSFCKQTRNIMGTFVSIIVEYPNPEEVRRIVALAFQEIYRISDLMNVYDQRSEVSILNRNGFCEYASPDMIEVIRRANCYSELSGGAFDISILPILDLWAESISMGRSPSDLGMAEKLELVNYRDILIESQNIRFAKPGMEITLSSVAKGYAVDKAIEILSRNDIKYALVNGGGDIRAISGIGNSPWRIGVRDPKNSRRIITAVELHNQAIATSGTYQRSFKDIIEPKSGRPSEEVISSTVIANKTTDADILATSILVLGVESGMRLIENLSDTAALIVTRNGEVLKSSLWRKYYRIE